MSKRMDRADGIMIEKLSNIINSLNDPRLQDHLITVSSVKLSTDFMYCSVMISVLCEDIKTKNDIISILRKSSGYIKKKLSSELNMPNVPQLKFILDNGYDNTKKINEILNSLVIPPEEEDYED